MNSISYPSLIIGAIVFACLALCPFGNATDTVKVWYGNYDSSPIWVFPGYPTRVDVWIQTGRTTSVTELHLCLGALDEYIDSLFIIPDSSEDCIYGNWDSALMLTDNYHTPPNNPGWSSQSFIGKADTGGAPNDPINTTYPKRIISFYLQPKNNPNLIGDTIPCLGAGQNPTLGESWVFGTIGFLPLKEYYSSLNFVSVPETCVYMIDSLHIYSFQNIMVSALKGRWIPPPFAIYCSHPSLPGNHLIRAMFDYNGDCRFSGADVAHLAGYYKGKACKLYNCPLTPYKIIYYR